MPKSPAFYQTISDIGYQLDSKKRKTVGLVSPNFYLVSDSLVVRVDGCQPKKGPRFDPRRGTKKGSMIHSFNFVFCFVGECISCAADAHLATDLTCEKCKMSLREYP